MTLHYLNEGLPLKQGLYFKLFKSLLIFIVIVAKWLGRGAVRNI